MDYIRRPPSTSHSARSGGSTTNASYTSTGSGYRDNTSNPLVSTSNPFYATNGYTTATGSRPRTARRSTSRPGTARPRTGLSTIGIENQEIVCAVSESRGVSPSVGLAFLNMDTGEAVLSQFSDSQTYVRTIHKLCVFSPTVILVVASSASPKSKLYSILEDSIQDDLDSNIILFDRRHWSENTGLEYIQQLAFSQDVNTIKTAVTGNYYAVCCFAAVMKYTELANSKRFPFHSLRMKYEPSEGSMMIDMATIKSLELVQNLQNAKSKDCLFGLLNETLTPMGARLLRSNILQPITSSETLTKRFEAVEELSTKEETFFAVRQCLKPFLDADRTLTQLIMLPTQASLKVTEQSINNVILLKQFVGLVKPVFEALTGSRSDMLISIRDICDYENIEPVQELIDHTINEGTTYAKQPLDFRNQRTYAVKSGVNGLLDVARQTYKEAMTDALQHIEELGDAHSLPLQTKFDNVRHFFLRLRVDELEEQNLPPVFINIYRKKDMIECQTLDLIKLNQKIGDAHMEVLLMSDKSVKQLIEDVREHMSNLFRICESIAMLDMLSAFAHAVSSEDYVRPALSDTLAIRAGRHPIREKIHNTKYIPNDVYATQQTRFQIIMGCNMSGKSTYIRSIALMTIMAQIGSFVPASYAAFPIIRQLFARISLDDNIEANVSSFAAEMRETAFIMHNINRDSLVIIDELGRGTSTRDGLAIALAIAEALVESRALIWFATHFRDLSRIMAERNGVINLHLAVDMSGQDRMEMLYRIASGTVQEKHYGLKLARVVPLPPDVIPHAETVAFALERQVQRKQKRSQGIVLARRRKLLLNLKEHLMQARDGGMDDETLKAWLKDLQKEFVVRMTALEEEGRSIEAGEFDEEEDEEERSTSEGGDVRDTTETAASTGYGQHSGRGQRGANQRQSTPDVLRDASGIEIVDATEDDSQDPRTSGSSSARHVGTAAWQASRH